MIHCQMNKDLQSSQIMKFPYHCYGQKICPCYKASNYISHQSFNHSNSIEITHSHYVLVFFTSSLFREISSSQQNFFRMLDQKIDDVSWLNVMINQIKWTNIKYNVVVVGMLKMQGPDYDSSSETEMALEEARLNALVQHWESASLTASSICSSASRSLQGTPVRTGMRCI